MSEPQRIFQKSLNYAIVYADGVLFELGGRVSRLIFYQEELDINDDRNAIDKTRKVITQKFEVRVPHRILKRLSETVQNMSKLSDEVLKMTEGIDDEKVTDVWYRFQTNLEGIVYDTNDAKPNYQRELGEDYNELQGRIQRKKEEPTPK